MAKPKNDDVTIYKVRLPRKNKRVVEDLVRAFAILLIMTLFFGLAYACDVMIKKDTLREIIDD